MTALSYWIPVKKYIVAHKAISGVIAVALLGGIWWAYNTATAAPAQTRYILGTVASSTTIISTVSASGQVAASNSIDIKPQVSGQITWIGVKAGQTVYQGQALASIDSTDARQTLQEAESNLATDKLNFQKSQAQAPIDYQNDQTTLANAQTDLQDSYNDMFNDLTGVYLDLPAVMTTSQTVLYGYDFDNKKVQWNVDALMNIFNPTYEDTTSVKSFQTTAVSNYNAAKTAYQNALSAYQLFTRTSDNASMDAMLSQSITMTTAVAQALQSELNYLGSASDLANKNNISLPANFSSIQSSARTNLATANTDLSKLLVDKKTLTSNKQAIVNAQHTISLDQVGNTSDGSNPISLQVSANNIAKEEQDIANQKADLAKYTIVAPFNGTLSAVDAKVGDTAGSSAVATIITHSQIANLSLNEVDAAKIKLGQKATLTFDAIDGLTLTGTIAEIDSVGTVSQGVVSYQVQISFDTQDPRIKPGMTINASIQTGVVQDALSVPSSAVKTLNGESYVQMFTPPLTDTGGTTGVTSDTPPQMVPVTIGISDDTNIQILSGLEAGQQIVVGTRSSTKTTTSAARPTTGGAGGNRGFGGGGGGIRIGG